MIDLYTLRLRTLVEAFPVRSTASSPSAFSAPPREAPPILSSHHKSHLYPSSHSRFISPFASVRRCADLPPSFQFQVSSHESPTPAL